MSLKDYIKSPWAGANLHRAYVNSFLHMRPAPEYASGEVVLASTYRYFGFSKDEISEGKVPALGRDFQKRIKKGRKGKEAEDTGVDADAFLRIVSGTLRSPKQPNQTAKRFLQISPVVPDACIYSLSARLTSNSWNPGALIARVMQFGEPAEADVQERCNQLFHALSVGENDDIWARFIQKEFQTWRGKNIEDAWSLPRQLERDDTVKAWHRSSTKIPAERFTKDLQQVISLKQHLTRRQWVSMLESMLRLGSASHIMWLCRANAACFKLMRSALEGNHVRSLEEITDAFSLEQGFWRYGQYSSTSISDAATGFVKARLGINLLLHQLEEVFGDKLDPECLSNIDSITKLVGWLGQEEIRNEFDSKRFSNNYQDIIEFDPRIIAGKKGVSSNIKEFLQHVLGQRQTSEAGLDNYDQGFFLAKKNNAKSGRWVVSLGPVSVLAMVHSCTYNAHGPRTIDNLCQHLSEYGIEIDAQEVADSMLGQTLRNLGLVLDSPDAEGGMVLINPFELITKEAVS
ncbi:MAG: hypothetical protein P8N58_06815 [Emcibacteraceae bacterium]|nr:hypothetical protein [Emcibacteraceae bacterium]